ncbi:MAG: cupin domain-containing protein [Pseudomonadota bacterium]|nr:MAG: cupin domain-containing protein [Pseudomonadota bacterium]
MKLLSSLAIATLALLTASTAYGFEDGTAIKVKTILKTTTTWEGKPIVYPQGQAEITGLTIELAPGGETGWHAHPVPSFGMILEGTLAVTLKDGRTRVFQAGDSVAEVIGTLHNGRNVGEGPVKLLVFYAGSVDTPLTVKAPAESQDKR